MMSGWDLTAGPEMSWRKWTLLGLLAVAVALTACGGDKAETEAPGAEPGVDVAAAPPDGMPGEMPPGEMPGGPMPGEPMPGGPMPGGPEDMMGGDALPGAPPPVTMAAAKPIFPGPSNPFRPLNPPSVPPPAPPPPPPPPPPIDQVRLLPIRAPFVVTPREREDDAPTDNRLPGLRTSIILYGGASVKAVLQFNDESFQVRPGDTVPIPSPGGRELTVVSISGEGVRLRNDATGRIYLAPSPRGS